MNLQLAQMNHMRDRMDAREKYSAIKQKLA